MAVRGAAAEAASEPARSAPAKTRREVAGSGVLNNGTRAEVTGGRHLDDLQALLVRVFVDGGLPAHLMDVKKRPIAGYFRRDKSWDIVVMAQDRVAGIIELKSMAGPSGGKNFQQSDRRGARLGDGRVDRS